MSKTRAERRETGNGATLWQKSAGGFEHDGEVGRRTGATTSHGSRPDSNSLQTWIKSRQLPTHRALGSGLLITHSEWTETSLEAPLRTTPNHTKIQIHAKEHHCPGVCRSCGGLIRCRPEHGPRVSDWRMLGLDADLEQTSFGHATCAGFVIDRPSGTRSSVSLKGTFLNAALCHWSADTCACNCVSRLQVVICALPEFGFSISGTKLSLSALREELQRLCNPEYLLHVALEMQQSHMRLPIYLSEAQRRRNHETWFFLRKGQPGRTHAAALRRGNGAAENIAKRRCGICGRQLTQRRRKATGVRPAVRKKRRKVEPEPQPDKSAAYRGTRCLTASTYPSADRWAALR